MRPLEISLSLLILAVFLPVGVLIAILIKVTSPGPVFFRPWRAGKGEIPFQQIKFRTMVAGAESMGPSVTGRDDPRVTRLGRLLRRTKIDELPQLINVVKGDMSLVGPRPEAPSYIEHYTADQRRVLQVRPGITSPASIAYRHEEQYLAAEQWEELYLSDFLPAKLELELKYLSERNFWKDISILFKTARVLLARPTDPDTARSAPSKRVPQS